MIKFFNKIRKQLLDENKTGKPAYRTGRYLKYAIGEIILVMIGILLALQVNNWNQSRSLAKEELQMMKSLHKEFSKNVIRFDEAYEFHLNRKKGIETILSINARDLSMDSLKSLFRDTHRSYTFDPYQGIYNSIINSGKIELISNDSLKERISGFQDLLMDFREEEDLVINFSTQNLHKLVLSEALFDNYKVYRGEALASKDEEQRIKEKYIKFIESDVYEGQLIFLSSWMNSIFVEGPILKEEMVSILNSLESEIEKHD